MTEAAELKMLAAAKLRRWWRKSPPLPESRDAAWEAYGQWKPRMLSVVKVEELNERTRRWQASKMKQDEGVSARSSAHALALCEWQGVVDRNDVDMVMDLGGNTTLMLAAAAGDDHRVELLLDAGCDPKAINKVSNASAYMRVCMRVCVHLLVCAAGARVYLCAFAYMCDCFRAHLLSAHMCAFLCAHLHMCKC